MILAVVNMKGGTGKSTVATNLAACFAAYGTDVLLVDADPQASALAWQRDRPAHVPPVSVIGLPVTNLHREIPRFEAKYPVILIDGGGQITATSKAAVAVANFLLVPTEASTPDIRSTERFFTHVVEEVAAIKGQVAAAILVTKVKTRTTVNAAGQVQIKALGYPVLASVLAHRVTYPEAFSKGMSVVEYDPQSKAAEEVLALYRELQEGL